MAEESLMPGLQQETRKSAKCLWALVVSTDRRQSDGVGADFQARRGAEESPGDPGAFEEREKGFEPSTLALARRCSTAELFPHWTTQACYQPPPPGVKHEGECGVRARACLDAMACPCSPGGTHPCTFVDR